MPIHLTAFIATVALLAVLPGANNASITRQTLAHGRRAGWLAVAGASIGILIWASAAAVGLSAMLLANPRAYLAIRLAGAAVLGGLGLLSLAAAARQRRGTQPTTTIPLVAGLPLTADPAPTGLALTRPAGAGSASSELVSAGSNPSGAVGRRSFAVGVATSLGNPKAGVVAISLIPQFVSATGPVLASSMLLGLIWAAVSGTWFTLYVWAVNRARTRVQRPGVQWAVQAVTGVSMVGLGVAVALGV
jgi:threonine/homoserine/homoserine lactone efflux protein